ncbi:MAG TPA: rod shape-determining protein MreC [Actinomycetota bacterium]|nr:rod shape-determining protein MreC [Actinomycetota bacterium]
MAARSGPRNTRLLVVALVVASLTIITVDYRQGDSGPLAAMGRTARTFMAPLQEAVTNVTRPVGNFFSGVAHLPSLAQENTDLKQQLADAQARINATSQIEAQNQELLSLLNLKQSLRPPSVPAVVISNGMSNVNYYITIDRGSNDGVRVNDPVVTGNQDGARLVGIVARVTSISADVRLLIDEGFSVPGRLATSGETGLVVGNGDQDLTMQDIPATTTFPTGTSTESVFTITYSVGDQHSRFPPNILIGTVSSVVQGGVQPDATVSVRPAVDFSSLEAVLVLQTANGGSS